MESSESKRAEILSKIRKLLELSRNNPSENEAMAAALKAQKLMAQNDVKDYEVAGDGFSEPLVAVETEIYTRRGWRFELAYAVATNFRCKYYNRYYKNYDSRCQRSTDPVVVFYGYRTDAKAAMLVFENLYKVGDLLANRCYREYKESGRVTAGVYNSYTGGFVAGVRSELEKQSKELMLVVPAKVEEGYSELDLNFIKPYVLEVSDIGVYSRGYDEGKDAVMSRRFDE